MRRTIPVLIATAITISATTPATPAVDAGMPETTFLRGAARVTYLDLDRRIADLRRAFASGRVGAMFDAVLEQPGGTVADASVDASVRGVAGMADVVEVVDEMAAAIRTADAMLADLAPVASPDLVEGSSVRETLVPLPSAGAPIATRPRVEAVARGGPRFDPAAVRTAAALVVTAVDAGLASLRSFRTDARPGGHVDGCDVVDELPYVCVGSEADNVYTEDAALLVDLGGDDRYLNSAGGAPFRLENDQAVNVSVNLDLGGNDRYTGVAARGTHVSAGRSWVGQGAAFGYGVGLLVDAAGDDLYSVTVPPVTLESSRAIVALQGAGISAGIGGLVDLAGDDTYLARGPSGPMSATVAAQGGAIADSTAWLVDDGGGDDRYEAGTGAAVLRAEDAGPVTPSTSVRVQGAADGFSSALAHDDGGRDAFLATASAVNEQTDLDAATGYQSLPRADLLAQGSAAFTSKGFLLTGDGDTTYRLESSGTGKAEAVSQGQGGTFGVIGTPTIAALDDAGGDDEYLLSQQVRMDRRIEILPGCKDLDGKPCRFAEAVVVGSPAGRLIGQGAMYIDGHSLLRDSAGADRYRAVASERMDVTLDDRLHDPVGPPSLDVTGFYRATVYVQGGSGGILVDREGTDDYLVSFEKSASATARSDHAPGTPRATAFIGAVGGTAQGTGGYGAPGVFLDLAGTGDRVESIARAEVTTAPDPDGAFLWPGIWPTVQGAGAASTFAVLGDSPTIVSSPSRPACPGSVAAFRGFGRWVECPVGVREENPQHQSFDIPRLGTPSTGSAPGAIGAPTSIAITPDTPTTAVADHNEAPTPDGVRLPVGATVRDANGAPLAGVTVHFTLQIDFGDSWPVVWQVDATTDDQGVARASLPLLKTGLQPEGPWRVAATYDGGSGRYPAHTAMPITLTG